MGNVANTASTAGAGSGTEIKVNIEKLDRNIEDMRSLCTSIVNYTTELSFTNSKGSSVNIIVTIYEQFVRLQGELTAFYTNTTAALQMTRDTFNAVDNIMGNFFKELTVDEG